eukprot:gene18453-biopygen2417
MGTHTPSLMERPGVTGHWRGRGAGMARAYRPYSAWVARAWRGHGAGVARARPVIPGQGLKIFDLGSSKIFERIFASKIFKNF